MAANSLRTLPICDGTLAPYVPCTCPDDLAGSGAVCRVGVDDSLGQLGRCGFHVHDARTRIDDVRLFCKGPGAACDDSSVYCCKGLACDVDGNGGRACFAVPSGASTSPSASASAKPARVSRPRELLLASS